MNTQFLDESLPLCKTINSLEAVAEEATNTIGNLTESELYSVLYLATAMYDAPEMADKLNSLGLEQLISYAQQLADAVEGHELDEVELDNLQTMAKCCTIDVDNWTAEQIAENWIETIDFLIRERLTGCNICNNNEYGLYNDIYDYYRTMIDGIGPEWELEECQSMIDQGKEYCVRFDDEGEIEGLDVEEYADLMQSYWGGYGDVSGVENTWELPNGQTLILVR
jgi:hypothetical protein